MPMRISVRVDDHGVKVGTSRAASGLVEASRDELDEFWEDVQYQASGGYAGGDRYDLVAPRGYPRTGNYGRSFVRERVGLTYRLSNATYTPGGREYGGYVGGDSDGGGQAWMHVGFWPTVRGAVDKMVQSELVSRMDRKLTSFFQSLGLGL